MINIRDHKGSFGAWSVINDIVGSVFIGLEWYDCDVFIFWEVSIC